MSNNVAILIRALITVMLLVSTAALITLLAYVEIPPANKEPVIALLGVVATLTTQSVMWWFGSSKGSSDKTTILASEAK